MKCNEAKRRLHLLYYQELNERESDLIQKHLEQCSHCRKEYTETITLLNAIPQPSPNQLPGMAESSWARILAGIPESTTTIRPIFNFPGKVAAAIVLFALGLGTGLWMNRDTTMTMKPTPAPVKLSLSRQELNGYLEDLEMLLLDASKNPGAIQTASLENERDFAIDRLMFQNRQLSRNYSSPPHIRDLLEETALLLHEIRNHPHLESEGSAWLPRIIEQRRLRVRIRDLRFENREFISMEDKRAPLI